MIDVVTVTLYVLFGIFVGTIAAKVILRLVRKNLSKDDYIVLDKSSAAAAVYNDDFIEVNFNGRNYLIKRNDCN